MPAAQVGALLVGQHVDLDAERAELEARDLPGRLERAFVTFVVKALGRPSQA